MRLWNSRRDISVWVVNKTGLGDRKMGVRHEVFVTEFLKWKIVDT
jgi:hypothetical protein